AEQAVEKVRTQEFDLLISDIGLPDRSGYDLMREVRLNKRLPGIALSGFGSEQDVNQAREAGFAEHLTKPINFERLEKTIHSLLSCLGRPHGPVCESRSRRNSDQTQLWASVRADFSFTLPLLRFL